MVELVPRPDERPVLVVQVLRRGGEDSLLDSLVGMQVQDLLELEGLVINWCHQYLKTLFAFKREADRLLVAINQGEPNEAVYAFTISELTDNV